MVLKKYVKRAPSWWKFLPYFKRLLGMLFFNSIYLRSDIFDDLKREDPDPQSTAILLHEETHRERQVRIGMFSYHLKYAISPEFRLTEELKAHENAMRYLKQKGQHYDFDKWAKGLSSWVYGWMISYKRARQELKKLWEDC